MNKLKIIEAEGSYYDIGFKVGSETKEQIKDLISKTKRIQSNNPVLQEKYKQYLKYILKYKSITEEIQGLADGANVTFEEIAKLNIVELNRYLNSKVKKQVSREEADADNCSTLVVRSKNKILIGHNEDGGYNDEIFLLKATYPSKIRINSITYIGSIPGFAVNINSEGLIILCNSLTAKGKKISEPKRIMARRLIECKNIPEAINIINQTKRSQGQNWFFCQDKRIYNVETSPNKTNVKELKENFYHCNNFIIPEMIKYENRKRSSGTFSRSQELLKIYKKVKTIKDIKEKLSSHNNRPKCLCAHGKEERDINKTLGSIYFNINKKEMMIGKGFTCQAVLEKIDTSDVWK